MAVHRDEVEEYEEKEGGEIWVLPDETKGNMAKVRNWILEQGWKKDKWLLMMDDDVRGVYYFERKDRRSFRDEEDFEGWVCNGFEMTEDLGAKLWGVNLSDDRRFYRETTPFSLISVVLGTFCGVLPNPLRYDERIYLKEDYDYALQHLQRYHKILRFNKFFYVAEHKDMSGGVTSVRSMEKEREHMKRLQRKWGKIVRVQEGDINPIIKVPIKGV